MPPSEIREIETGPDGAPRTARIDHADPTTVHGVLARLDALGLEVLEVRRGDHPGRGDDPAPPGP